MSVRARENQRLLLTIAAGVVVIALFAYGIYFYRSNREKQAQDALATAIDTIESPLIPATLQPGQTLPPNAKFKTDAERIAAAEPQFKAVSAKFDGTDASDVASLYLARISASRGDVTGARKLLEEFVSSHKDNVLVGSARYSLYQLRIDTGEAQQVATELNAELSKAEPVLPNDAILSLLAHSYEAQGDAAKSRDTYRRIATEFPDSPYVLEAQRRAGAA
ncbi:MAG TPA: tetratricopeptide repeat protein [Thermoanaerobaculia bacterium]|nr:tetratricopeptide repeat protein [Thermoanaerobaculia bacterium]